MLWRPGHAPLILAVLLPAVSAAQEAQETPFLFHRPHFGMGAGELTYREHHFDIAPGLKSNFSEPFVEGRGGWDFIFTGQNALTVDFAFLETKTGTETWKDSGALVQQNTLDVGRFSFEIGYLWSTWNRAVPPIDLGGISDMVRFGVGANTFYRRQAFDRDHFSDFTTSPPTTSDANVKETFDMLGAEVVLDLELGPRQLVAFFARGKGGGGYTGVLNDGLEPLVKKEDARLDTGEVHGTLEAGLVTQPNPRFELRAGYRYLWQEVFEKKRTVNAVDPVLGPVTILIDLPDNTTIMHMGYIEVAIPF